MIIDPPSNPSSDYQFIRKHGDGDSPASTSIDSPPPYEPGDAIGPSLIQDEKRRHIEAHPKAPTLEPGVYTEPPPAFSRIAAISVAMLAPFKPMTIQVEGSGKALDKGFVLSLPTTSEAVHPFEQRDIHEGDWMRFMQDLKDGTTLSMKQRNKALLIPLFLGLGPAAYCISQAVKGRVRKQKLTYALNLINIWNQHFFTPRRVEVILMRGSEVLTKSQSGYAEELLNNHNANTLFLDESTSSGGEVEQDIKGAPNPRAMRLVVVPL